MRLIFKRLDVKLLWSRGVSLKAVSLLLWSRGKTIYILPSSYSILTLLLVGFTEYDDDDDDNDDLCSNKAQPAPIIQKKSKARSE
ncbi:hypothetical protein Hanom_Chr01g00085831 [Helianthus anomalus]